MIPTKYRKRVEVFIINNNTFIMGINKKGNIQFPGGGIESGDSIIETARKETLEELGVSITDIELITKESLKVNWYELQSRGFELNSYIKERMKRYRGSETFFTSAKFNGIDKSAYGSEGDELKPITMSYNNLLKRFTKEASQNDMFSKYSKFRLKILKELKRKGKI